MYGLSGRRSTERTASFGCLGYSGGHRETSSPFCNWWGQSRSKYTWFGRLGFPLGRPGYDCHLAIPDLLRWDGYATFRERNQTHGPMGHRQFLASDRRFRNWIRVFRSRFDKSIRSAICLTYPCGNHFPAALCRALLGSVQSTDHLGGPKER